MIQPIAAPPSERFTHLVLVFRVCSMSYGETRARTGAHTLFGPRVNHSLGGESPKGS